MGNKHQEGYEAFLVWRAKGKSKDKVKDKVEGKGKELIRINCADKGHIIAQCPKPVLAMKFDLA